MVKSKKLMAVNALILDLPLSIVVTLVALLVGKNFSTQAFIMNCILAYIITFLINMFVPFPKWGFAFASKFAQPATFQLRSSSVFSSTSLWLLCSQSYLIS